MFLSVLSQAMDAARRKFSRGEQSMLIDIFNGTALTPGILGQHLAVQVEDSFDLYPGVYEEKWGADKKEMLVKIGGLSPLESALVELWAVGFWAINGEGITLESYLLGKIDISTRLAGALALLQIAGDRLERTKSAFKSAAVAEVRAEISAVAELLEGLIS